MQDISNPIIFEESPVNLDRPAQNDESPKDQSIENEIILLKAQFLCRMGIGPRAISAMPKETHQKITIYHQEKVASEESSPTGTCSDDFDDEDDGLDAEQDPEAWVKKNLMKRNMLLKAHMLSRMGMATQTLESLSPKDKAKLARIHEQHLKERETEDEYEEEPDQEQELTVERTYTNAEGDFLMNFHLKTDEQVRSCYYNRLIQMKILKLTPSIKNQSIIIFDWDDTLLPTTYLVTLGLRSVTPSIISVLKPLDESASKLLEKTADSGKVYIITNAEEGWVQYSSQVFMPKTKEVIKQRNITIISARSCYQGQFPKDCKRWKKEAFTALTKDYDTNIVTNLVCLGDSHIEIDAAHVLAKQFDKAIIKTIKFKELPQPEELCKQQNLVLDKYDPMFVSLKDLTIRLEKKAAAI